MTVSDQLFAKLIKLLNDLIKKDNNQDAEIKELSEMIKTSNLYINEETENQIKTNIKALEDDTILSKF